ncbi:hypothetical protein KH5H1_77550 [Corallococcus caeni]|nr:hypothetical protein KH5H1_77550 [Corallococcus sp. KH5-1]
MEATAGGSGVAVGLGTGLSRLAEHDAAAGALAPFGLDAGGAGGGAGGGGVGMVGLGAGDAGGVRGDSVQARQAARRQADSRGARFMSPGLVHHAGGTGGAHGPSVQEPSGGARSGLRACVVWGLRLLLRHRKAVLRD